jgi:hypothetical protein
MNSVAGVLKLYFRELKEPLFARDMFDSFIGCIGKKNKLSIELNYLTIIF